MAARVPWNIPVISAPPAWADAEGPRTSEPDLPRRVGAYLQSDLSALLAAVRDDVAAFGATLRGALTGPSRSALVSGFPAERTPTVTALLSAHLGGATYPAAPEIGGPLTVVTSGARLRHDQAWHTDSTPWHRPNRWTILGMLRTDSRYADAATEILPWSSLDRDRRLQPLLPALRAGSLPWRIAYPDLPALQAPVLGPIPRWIRPAVAAVWERLDPVTGHALRALDQTLGSQSRWHRAVIGTGSLLVFDNHAVLHRGPDIRGPSERTLLRIKVDGLPLPHDGEDRP